MAELLRCSAIPGSKIYLFIRYLGDLLMHDMRLKCVVSLAFRGSEA